MADQPEKSWRVKLRESRHAFAWTARTSWRASQRMVVLRSTISLIDGLTDITQALVIWWAIDQLLPAWRKPELIAPAMKNVAVVAAVFVLIKVIVEMFNRRFGNMAYFTLRPFFEYEQVRKNSELDLATLESAADNELLQKRGGLERTACGVMDSLFNVIYAGVVLVGLVVLSAMIGWQAFAMLAAMFAIEVAAIPFVKAGVRQNADEIREKQSRFFYFQYLLSDKIPAKEVRLFALNDFLLGQYRQLSAWFNSMNMETWTSSIKLAAVNLVRLSLFVTFGYWLVTRVLAGDISIGLAVAFCLAVNIAKNVSWILGRIAHALEGSSEGIAAYEEFMRIKPTIVADPKLPAAPENLGKGIVFENVGLSYITGSKPALADINITIRPGERIALVGENGSGKTTLVKLLTRLYDPSQGRVLLDGKDLREFNVDSYRKRVGVIFQDFVQYHGSVSENVAYSDPSRIHDEAAIAEALRKSGGDAVVATLKDGLKTQLGSWFVKGADLSVGQWQKIALARAFFREADLLVLDEPTAALDPRAEYEIFQRFLELTRGKTTVLISHRFSTVRMADTIYVFNQGRIVEHGSHTELMAKGGSYAELFNMQAEGYLHAGDGTAGR